MRTLQSRCPKPLKGLLELAGTQPQKFEMRPVWGANLQLRTHRAFLLTASSRLETAPLSQTFGTCYGFLAFRSMPGVKLFRTLQRAR